MVTVIAGKPNNTLKCKIISSSDAIGSLSEVEFDISNRKTMKPGEPKWANYVKGCIADFKSTG